MNAFEHRREHIAGAVVAASVVAVGRLELKLVGVCGGDADAKAQRRVELAVDLTDLEGSALCTGTENEAAESSQRHTMATARNGFYHDQPLGFV